MPSSRQPLSRTEKTAIFVCVALIVPVGAIFYVFGGRDAEPNWNIAPAVPRPTPNGYDYYVAAAKATVRFKPEVDPASDAKAQPSDSAYALKNYSVARREQWLKANAQTFSLVNKGLRIPSMTPDASVMGAFRNWASLRQLARDMSARTRTLQMEKKPGAATMSAIDTMQMAQDTSRGGGMIARLVAIAIAAIGRMPLDDFDETINALSASEARGAALRLEKVLSREPSEEQILITDKRDSLLELQRFLGTPGWRGPFKPQTNTFSEEEEGWAQVWERQTIPKQTIYDNVVRALDANITTSKQPYSKAKNPATSPPLDIFSKDIVGGTRIIQLQARNATSNNMLLLRLALRAYIAEQGQAPPNLSALVPRYLQNVPTDVYNDDKPLFYTPQGKTYKLWSVGPDCVNDGGVPLAPRYGALPNAKRSPVSNTLDNKGDFVAGLCR